MPIVRVIIVDKVAYVTTLGHYGTYSIVCKLMLIINGQMTIFAKQEQSGKVVTMMIIVELF